MSANYRDADIKHKLESYESEKAKFTETNSVAVVRSFGVVHFLPVFIKNDTIDAEGHGSCYVDYEYRFIPAAEIKGFERYQTLPAKPQPQPTPVTDIDIKNGFQIINGRVFPIEKPASSGNISQRTAAMRQHYKEVVSKSRP